jgi:hypothetical protein
MAGIMTKCNGCCFFNSEDGSCKQKLHDVFREADAKVETIDGVCLIDRICQYRREDDWGSDLSLEDKIKTCQDEVYISGTIVLVADNLDSLSNAIDKLVGQKDQFKFIILYKNLKYNDLLEICGNSFKQYKLINYLTDDIAYHVHQSLKHARNGYVFILDCNKNIDGSIIDKINHIVNIKLIRLLHVPGSDGLHESVSMIHIYRWLKGDLAVSFEAKLLDISLQEESHPQILTWKEVNEKYST